MRITSTFRNYLLLILLASPLLLLVVIAPFAMVVPTGAMEDTLLIGDHVVVNLAAYGIRANGDGLFSRGPRRGDVIVLLYPVDITQVFVKRVIGVPGDRIHIVNKQLFLNGRKVDEPYAVHKMNYLDSFRDNFPSQPNLSVDRRAIDMLENHVVRGEVVVPPNSYFAMGDNRDSSLDSRYWGFVPRENIIGKPLIIYWSYDAPPGGLNGDSISASHVVDLAENFFSKTRWKRSFMPIHGYPIH